MRRVSEIYHREEGILYPYRHRVKPRSRLPNATIHLQKDPGSRPR